MMFDVALDRWTREVIPSFGADQTRGQDAWKRKLAAQVSNLLIFSFVFLKIVAFNNILIFT